MKKIAIIPARGGSKRIPRKNIKDFLGQPIIAYSIQIALESELFDEVMVSTDDEEIAKVALQYGATVPFMRSKENANDFATTVDVLIEVLECYQEKGITFKNICCLYPCAPLVTVDNLNKGCIKLTDGRYDSVVPIVKFGFPIQRAFKISDDNLAYFQPEHEKTRSQDLEAAYHDAGQFYWSTVSSILKNRSLITTTSSFIVLDEMEVQDIDHEVDWKLAELKYQIKHVSK